MLVVCVGLRRLDISSPRTPYVLYDNCCTQSAQHTHNIILRLHPDCMHDDAMLIPFEHVFVSIKFYFVINFLTFTQRYTHPINNFIDSFIRLFRGEIYHTHEKLGYLISEPFRLNLCSNR